MTFMDSQLLDLLIRSSDQQTNMNSTKSDKTSADDDKIKSDLFKLVEKLRIELQKKDQELHVKDLELQKKEENLAKEKQEKQELSANLDLAMSRVNQVNEMENWLVNAQQIIHALQLSLWKSFPSPANLSYYIKIPVRGFDGLPNGQFRYLSSRCSSLTTAEDRHRGEFKFTKNSDGSVSIYSPERHRYLKISTYSSNIEFTDNKDNAEKFVLFFHQQNQLQQPGISVDISTLAGYFLGVNNNNFVVANSHTPPADKFLIVPVDVQ